MRRLSGSSSKPSYTVLPHQTPRLRDHYTLGRKLGQGQFGTTFHCIEKGTGTEYACKSIPKRKLLCREDYEDVWRERGHYTEKKAAHLMKTIVGVVEACHSLGVMHRDLKPENFLFDTPDEDAKLKATDFGLSVFYKPGHPWIVDDTVAPDKPLGSAVLSRLKQFSAMNKLKKMALRVIAERLSEEEIGGLKQLFRMIDTDNSGAITFDELKQGLKRVGSELTESEIKALMEAADVDNNGTIDYGEFLAATLHMNKIEREENLAAAFSFFDKDGSGYITIDELQQACKDFGIAEAHLDDMIKEADTDNDGRIDYGEFAAMMRQGNPALASRTQRGNFNFNLADALQGKTKTED
ncbi:UNVERIFIED_CONTAM: Calcium-dependent protein kinase [Sesamum calycinum]|uniref:non-specific serine/threonine protein kinase n=1 Tax=Sesamum calycinum TaxID=2727403 RepID=A0AAW2QP77_9LAMI